MVTQKEKDNCTPPAGKFLIVHVDPRDHWPTPHGEPVDTIEEVRALLDNMFPSMREAIRVFNDKRRDVSNLIHRTT